MTAEENIRAAAAGLRDAIVANAPECANRDHAINMIGDVLSFALWAVHNMKKPEETGAPKV
jgi:hypothetical protein